EIRPSILKPDVEIVLLQLTKAKLILNSPRFVQLEAFKAIAPNLTCLGLQFTIAYPIEIGVDDDCDPNEIIPYKTVILWVTVKDHFESIRLLLKTGIIRSLCPIEGFALAACSLAANFCLDARIQTMFEFLKLALGYCPVKQLAKVCISPAVVYNFQQECHTSDSRKRVLLMSRCLDSRVLYNLALL
ncbi:unnamed protein product, partial [Adineta ricciae]